MKTFFGNSGQGLFKKWMVAIWVSLFIFATGNESYAGFVFYEGFDYAVGGNISGSNGGTGWSNAWSSSGTGVSATVESVNFSAPTNYSLGTGSAFKLTPGTTSASISRPFVSNSIDLNPVATTTYYFSELFCRVDSSNGTSGETPYFLSLRNSSNVELIAIGTGSQEAVNISASATATGSTVSSVSTANNFYSVGTSLATTTQYLLIGKIVLNAAGTADTYSISLIPSSSAVSMTEPVTWDLTLSADTSGVATQLYIGTTVNAESLYIDNLALATDYLSVISAIPEPSTAVAMLVGVLMLAAGLCRKHFLAAS